MVKRGVVRCLGRIVWYDVCRSIPQCIPLYCVSFAVLAVLAARYDANVELIGLAPSPSEVLASFLLGSNPFDPDAGSVFVVPPTWFALNVSVACLVGFYPCSDYRASGCQVISRCRSTQLWFLGKEIWAMLVVFILYGGLLILCAVFGAGNGGLDSEVRMNVVAFDWNGESVDLNVLEALCVQISVSIALSIVQVAISLLTGPPVAMGVIVAYFIASCFFGGIPFVADCGMILRSSFCAPNGYDFLSCLSMCLLSAAVIIVTSAIVLRNVDFGLNLKNVDTE